MAKAHTDLASTAYHSRAPRLGFVPAFDGLRGYGIVLVVVQHASSRWSNDRGQYSFIPSAAGWIDLFFVLSAFLITSLLMQEHRSTGGINFKKFYSRRAIRLLPSSTLCLFAGLGFVALADPDQVGNVAKEVLAALLYVYHWFYPVGLGAVAPDAPPTFFDPFWSLSSEEQFYLGIGVVVLVCVRHRWMRQLAIVLTAAATYIGVARLMGDPGPWPGTFEAGNPLARGFSLLWLSRPDSLMWGAVLAIVNAELPTELSDRAKRNLSRAGLGAFLVFLFVTSLSAPVIGYLARKVGLDWPYLTAAPGPVEVAAGEDGFYWVNFGHTLSAWCSMVFVLGFARGAAWRPLDVFGWSPARLLGRMSYTVYVWHILWIHLLLWAILDGSGLGGGVVVAPLTIGAFLLSLPVYYKIERPLLNLKLRFASESETLDLNTGKMVEISDTSKGAK